LFIVVLATDDLKADEKGQSDQNVP